MVDPEKTSRSCAESLNLTLLTNNISVDDKAFLGESLKEACLKCLTLAMMVGFNAGVTAVSA